MTQPGVERAAGVSWLYNLPAYRRLFPAPYLTTAEIAPQRFRNMPLRGQFLDRQGTVRRAAATVLLDRLSRQTDMAQIAGCFPLQPLAVEAPLAEFYRFYGID